jgi:hypothetical protein
MINGDISILTRTLTTSTAHFAPSALFYLTIARGLQLQHSHAETRKERRRRAKKSRRRAPDYPLYVDEYFTPAPIVRRMKITCA